MDKMKNKRRDFLKLAGLAGISLAGSSGLIPVFDSNKYWILIRRLKRLMTSALFNSTGFQA